MIVAEEKYLDFGVEFLVVGVDGILLRFLITSFKQAVGNFNLHQALQHLKLRLNISKETSILQNLFNNERDDVE